MQLRLEGDWGARIRLATILLTLAAAGYVLRRPLLQVGALALGAGVLCFITAPLAHFYERRMSRPAAALAALLSLGLMAGLVIWLLLPPMLRELVELLRALPDTVNRVAAWLDGAQTWAEARLPGVALPGLKLDALQGALANVAGGTVSLAVNLADVIGRASMMAVLAYFFLCDRDRLLLRLELLLPKTFRHTAVRMGIAVCRELRLYLQGQLMIALAVAALSTAALALIGVRGALALGPIIGILNMIPYFGPFIGGIPAVLIALGDGWQKAALTLLALSVVQQLDGSWISPRIMGSLTGFSPALVLVGIFAGASLGGITGMLFALPAMMTVRTLFRVFVQKCENN